jgi:CheY-like chemotaxis protein
LGARRDDAESVIRDRPVHARDGLPGVVSRTAIVTRIVVADDNRPYLELLLALLGQMPRVEVAGTAADGHEAVRSAVENEADIALLDIEMPGLDGFAAAQAIRRARPQTELILHTGALLENHRRLGRELALPVFDKLQLEQTLQLLAERGRRNRAGRTLDTRADASQLPFSDGTGLASKTRTIVRQ